MIKLLVKKIIPDYKDTTKPQVREKYSVLAGVAGIICNCVLFILKLSIGLVMNSIAIISDAFNNLTDIGSSVFSIVGAKLSNKKPDKEHPFGHGRVEYIISLIVSAMILVVGIELGKTSISKMFQPHEIYINKWLIIFLSLSILIKLWMFSYNKYLSKQINSKMLKAASVDSLNDVFATAAVILSTVLTGILKIKADGVIGIAVSFLILKSGFDIAMDVIDTLIGSSPSPELVTKISETLLAQEGIYGIHDLIVHEYGPGNFIASVHAEVADDSDIVKIHETIDLTEVKILEELGVSIVIHMDPISLNDEKTNSLRDMILSIINKINPEFSIHDFRITDGENRVNLIFDLVVPYDLTSKEKAEVITLIKQEAREINNKYRCVIRMDMSY